MRCIELSSFVELHERFWYALKLSWGLMRTFILKFYELKFNFLKFH